MRASIHQPQYAPWLGYFFKILHSDVFVLFDTVQYPRGKHFGNRNQVKTAQGAHWLTVPILRRSELLPFRDIPIDTAQPWADKHWRTIELAYARAPYFKTYAPALAALYLERTWTHLTDLDLAVIEFAWDALQLPTRLVRASALDIPRAGMDTAEYIFQILRVVGADEYISGQGAGSRRYIDANAFARAQVQLWYYDFAAPRYAQLWGEFAADLSVLDVLFNCGPDARALLEQGGTLLPAEVSVSN